MKQINGKPGLLFFCFVIILFIYFFAFDSSARPSTRHERERCQGVSLQERNTPADGGETVSHQNIQALHATGWSGNISEKEIAVLKGSCKWVIIISSIIMIMIIILFYLLLFFLAMDMIAVAVI